MNKPDDVKHIIDVIVDVTSGFLDHEIGIKVHGSEQLIHPTGSFQLRANTCLMSISGSFNMNISFSFDEDLIDKIYRVYCQELQFDEHERSLHIDETAADVINIVIGNSTAQLAQDGTVVQISVPQMVDSIRTLLLEDDELLTATLSTALGKMSITAMPNNIIRCDGTVKG